MYRLEPVIHIRIGVRVVGVGVALWYERVSERGTYVPSVRARLASANECESMRPINQSIRRTIYQTIEALWYDVLGVDLVNHHSYLSHDLDQTKHQSIDRSIDRSISNHDHDAYRSLSLTYALSLFDVGLERSKVARNLGQVLHTSIPRRDDISGASTHTRTRVRWSHAHPAPRSPWSAA